MKNYLLKVVVAFVVLLSTFSATNAQYCGFESFNYWWGIAYIQDVVVEDLTEGNKVIERLNSGAENWVTIDETGGPYELNIGNKFKLSVRWGTYYRGYLRAYIDKNDDQRWDYNKMGPDEEFIGYRFRSGDYNIPPRLFVTDEMEFNIGDDVQEGPSQLRVMVNYYNYNTDPCIVYYRYTYYTQYGECEDYAINFVAPLPETYPTAGNILFNNQRYDGTTRTFNGVSTDFRLPAVESKGPQPTGTQIEYWITGPLPSTEVVYRALDPNTGSQSIRYNTPTQSYIMQSATGPASVSTNEGTFKASKGGEYKVNVKLTKTSGKSAQGAKIFTVANNYDMSVASVESPRTSRYPRFFKYLVNTNIDVTCQVQNTGLNPVKKFEVSAKIYIANTNVLASTLPKYVFDTENDPNLLPLQSGQKHEASFAAFSSYTTGEFYIQFEVSYMYDEEEYNNFLPRPDGEKHYFEVQHNDQLTAGEFESPISGQILKVIRPTTPKVVFLNNGVSDASNINFHMVVRNEAGAEVYNEVSFLEDMPQGRYNEKLVTFPNMVIREPGTYTACTWVDYPYDLVKDDDTTCVTFEVELGIQDTIAVGTSTIELKHKEINVELESNSFSIDKVMLDPSFESSTVYMTNSVGYSMNLVDMNGTIINTSVIRTDVVRIEHNDIPSGVYILTVTDGYQVKSKTINIIK